MGSHHKQRNHVAKLLKHCTMIEQKAISHLSAECWLIFYYYYYFIIIIIIITIIIFISIIIVLLSRLLFN